MFELRTANGAVSRGQNWFMRKDYTYAGKKYPYVYFEMSGTTQTLGGDNAQVSLLMPNEEFILRQLEAGGGNRNSDLTLTHLWLTPGGTPLPGPLVERYVGVGAGDSDTTIELRFRSPLDSVIARFPRRVLTAENVGVLPLNTELTLR